MTLTMSCLAGLSHFTNSDKIEITNKGDISYGYNKSSK